MSDGSSGLALGGAEVRRCGGAEVRRWWGGLDGAEDRRQQLVVVLFGDGLGEAEVEVEVEVEVEFEGKVGSGRIRSGVPGKEREREKEIKTDSTMKERGSQMFVWQVETLIGNLFESSGAHADRQSLPAHVWCAGGGRGRGRRRGVCGSAADRAKHIISSNLSRRQKKGYQGLGRPCTWLHMQLCWASHMPTPAAPSPNPYLRPPSQSPAVRPQGGVQGCMIDFVISLRRRPISETGVPSAKPARQASHQVGSPVPFPVP